MANKKRIEESSFKGEYPYVQTFESESGHMILIDDTPGNEMVRFSHRKGTYAEINSKGSLSAYSVGDASIYGKSGVSMTIDENGDIKMDGHARILVGGGAHIEVAGDAGIGVGGSTTLVSMGDLKAHVDNIYIGAKGNMNFNVAGSMEMKVAGSTNMETSGDHTVKAANIKLNP